MRLIACTNIPSTGTFSGDLSLWLGYHLRYFGLDRCCRRQNENKISDLRDEIFSSGDESETEFRIPFSVLTTEEKETRLLYLWKKVRKRTEGAVMIINKLADIRKKISIFGKPLKPAKLAKITSEKEARCIIEPQHPYKQYWTLYTTVLLFYSIIFVPVKVSFYDDSSKSMLIWDFIVDGSFFIDILLTFFTGIERNDHSIEKDHHIIAREYFKLWFWIDLMSTLPVGIFEL